MTKAEFLQGLERTLSGRIPEDEVRRQIEYYNEYYDTSGKTEEEVSEELGEPVIIAKTILTGYENANGVMSEIYEREARDEYSRRQKEFSDYEEEEFNTGTGKAANILFRFLFDRQSLKWYQKVLVVLGLIIFAAVFLSIVAVILDFAFTVIVPIILVLIVVGIIMSFVSRD